MLIKFSPLSLIDEVSFPTMQGAIELSLAKKISWHNEFGVKYRKPFNEKTDTNFLSSRGFKVKTEVRYYFKEASSSDFLRLQGYYLGANVYFLRDIHNAETRYYYQQDSSSIKIDNFGIKKIIWGTNLLVGKQFAVGKTFLIDIYSGSGVRFRDMSEINKEFDYKRDDLIEPKDVTIEGFKYKAESKGGGSVLPNLTLGLRLCYRL